MVAACQTAKAGEGAPFGTKWPAGIRRYQFTAERLLAAAGKEGQGGNAPLLPAPSGVPGTADHTLHTFDERGPLGVEVQRPRSGSVVSRGGRGAQRHDRRQASEWRPSGRSAGAEPPAR